MVLHLKITINPSGCNRLTCNIQQTIWGFQKTDVKSNRSGWSKFNIIKKWYRLALWYPLMSDVWKALTPVSDPKHSSANMLALSTFVPQVHHKRASLKKYYQAWNLGRISSHIEDKQLLILVWNSRLPSREHLWLGKMRIGILKYVFLKIQITWKFQINVLRGPTCNLNWIGIEKASQWQTHKQCYDRSHSKSAFFYVLP